jgi:hypothetical protein
VKLPIRVRLTDVVLGLLAALAAALGAYRRAAVPRDTEASIDRDLRRSSETIAVDYAERRP